MKKRIVLIICLLSAITVNAQLYTEYAKFSNIDSIIQKLFASPNVQITNVNFQGYYVPSTGVNGDIKDIGVFNSKNSTVGIDSGIILTTGFLNPPYGLGQPASVNANDFKPTAGDSLLNTLINYPTDFTLGGAVLEFDFVPNGDSIKFEYVFASDEYPDQLCIDDNDVFAFFISGPGITGIKNIALVPNSTYPVCIKSINDTSIVPRNYNISNCNSVSNAQYYVNHINDTNFIFNGSTTILTAKEKTIPCETYHMKFAIAEVGSIADNSAVFLKANSFNSEPLKITSDISYNNGDTALFEACSGAKLIIRRTYNLQSSKTYKLNILGSAINGIDYTMLPTTITMQPNQMYDTIVLQPIVDFISDNSETVIIKIGDTLCNGNYYETEITFVILERINLTEIEHSQQGYCDGLTVEFHYQSQYTDQYFWDFGEENNQNDTSSIFAPKYTYPDSGSYTVTLITKNTVANCSDTTYSTLTIAPPYIPTINAPDYFCLLDSSAIYSIVNPPNKNAIIKWDFGTHATPQYPMNDSVTNIKFHTSGDINITVNISQNNCNYFASKMIQVIDTPHVQINDATQYCVGQSVKFDCSSTSVSNYHWNFGIDGITNDTSTKVNPTYIYPDTGKYLVTLIGNNDYCPADTHSLTFYVYPKLQINPFPPIQEQCIDSASFNFEPKGIWDNTAQFHWYFLNGNPDSSVIQNPKGIKFDTLGYHKSFLIASQYGCTNQVMYITKVNPKPEVDFYANRITGCAPFTTQFFDTLLGGNPIKNYQWKYENTIDTSKSPIHTFNVKNSYDITLITKDINGCSNSLTKTNYINTDNKPYSDFIIKSNPVSILDPLVSIFDTSKNFNTNYYYILPNNEIMHDSIADFRLNDTGTFEILKIVTTNLGCSDTTIKYVRCNPFPTFSMPNVFTPNNDGINEEFIPKVKYAKQINFKIFNRWGELFFETNELNKGWDGKTKHNKTALSGTYFYQIYVEFFDGSIKTESGAFSLIL